MNYTISVSVFSWQAQTMTIQGNENDWDLTRTVEIQNVGATKIEIAGEAKKALEAKSETAPAVK